MALLLAGCAEIPHPFQPDEKPLPVAFAIAKQQASIITVAPVKGLPAPLGQALAEAMALALEKRSLPARVEREREGGAEAGALYRVSARFEAQPAPVGGEPAIVWELRDGGGLLVARQSQAVPPGSDRASPQVRDKLLAEAAGEPARMMVRGIEGDAPRPSDLPAAATAVAPPPGHRTLVLGKIQGAPLKDGDLTLRQAIVYALSVGAVRVVRERSADSLVLDAAIELSEPNGGMRHVKVTWVVARPDGRELGRVGQENNVPARLIERVWGEICAAVAQNAAGGIAALVAEADQAPNAP